MSEIVRREPFYQMVDGLRVPGAFSADILREALTYKACPGDFIVASYLKCGTTWTQMIVFLIKNQGQPASAPEFFMKIPYLEMCGLESAENTKKYSVKTHLDFERAPYSPEAKYLYICRNPKDVVVSFFHHTRTITYLFDDGEFDVFFDLFLEGKVDYGDYFDHVLSWYKHRNDPNVLFITYEEMRKDTKGYILKIAKFMGDEYAKPIEDDPEILENILKYSSMDEMKKVINDFVIGTAGNMSLTKEDMDALPLSAGIKHVAKFIVEHRTANSKHFQFIRTGIVGGWKDVLNEDQKKSMDDLIYQRMKGTEVYEVWKRANCL